MIIKYFFYPVQECRDTALGLGYRGTQSRSRQGESCKNWDLVRFKCLFCKRFIIYEWFMLKMWRSFSSVLLYQVPEYRRPKTWNFESLNISDEMNYCRNPDNDPLGLWCITNIETMEMDYCSVELCGQ